MDYEDALEDLDYEIYYQRYESMDIDKIQKQRPQATMPGKITHSAVPLSFTFMNIKEVNQLKRERTREGKRKPVELQEDTSEAKNENVQQQKEDNEENEVGITGVIVSRAQHNPQITSVLTNHYVSLQQQKNVLGGRKMDEGNTEEKKQKVIDL